MAPPGPGGVLRGLGGGGLWAGPDCPWPSPILTLLSPSQTFVFTDSLDEGLRERLGNSAGLGAWLSPGLGILRKQGFPPLARGDSPLPRSGAAFSLRRGVSVGRACAC